MSAAAVPQDRTWAIEPGRRVGPLAIGMPIDAALVALDAVSLGPTTVTGRAAYPVWTSAHHAVRIHPREPQPGSGGPAASVVQEVELIWADAEPLQVQLFGRPLLAEPLADVEQFLFAVDARAERHASLVAAPGLGVRVWSGGEPPHWPVSSVTVARPVPPARIIAPGFTFARLDRVIRAHDFTGGATTVRAPLVAGEPEVAEWSRRQVLLRYTFDPVSFLRVLYLDGPEAAAAPAVQRVLASLPLVGEDQILADLASDDEVAVLRAIQAAGVLRLTGALERLRTLSQATREPLHTAAISTLVALPDVRDQT